MHGFVPQHSLNYVSKGWGWESWIHNSEKYCGKILFIKKGKKCSFHYHEKKEETFFVQSGELDVIYSWGDHLEGASTIHLKQGDVFQVPPGLRHRMIAEVDTYVIEFSTQHFDEDSIRIIPGD